MSVGSGTPYNVHTGNGTTTVFAYGFTLLDEDDLVVTLDGVASTAFTVSGVGDDDGGSVTFTSAPASGVKVALRRVLTLQRLVDYQNNGDLLATVLNGDFDRLLMMIQGASDGNTRAVRAPFPETLDDLPAATDRAGKVLSFDDDGNPAAVAPDAGTATALAVDLASTASDTEGDALIGFKRSAVGAVAATLHLWTQWQPLNVREFGAVGDGVTDDTDAIQAAADAAVLARKGLYFPPPTATKTYRISAPIVFDAPIAVWGDDPAGTQIVGYGMDAGDYVFDFDCLAADVVEHVRIEGLTLRSDDGVPNALRLKNVAYALTKNVRLYNVEDGVQIEGTRCFTNTFENLRCDDIGGKSVHFDSSFTGGGQHTFVGCTFTGDTGFEVPTGAKLDNLNFSGCNWEQCTINGLYIGGTVAGLSIVGSRTEGCDSYDFVLRPFGADEYIGGVSISGVSFSASDNSAAARIRIGGDSGKVRGFVVSGSTVTHGTDLFEGALVEFNGDGGSGMICGNFLRGTTASGAKAVDEQKAGVIVFGNENLSGSLPEYWGLLPALSKGSFTATATGLTTAETGTVKYAIAGNTVTLDLPYINGTSNATTFTLTGAPDEIIPANDKDTMVRVRNSGTVAVGMLRIKKVTGVLEFYTLSGGGFTASGTKGVDATSVTYTLA